MSGSSPLARGLPADQPGCSLHHRIIPARAGFTAARCPPTAWVRDHPRSRGVYGQGEVSCPVAEGSSPLARGLPRLQSGQGHLPRIIPARAGVYVYIGDSSGVRGGSSPLARGLPHLRVGGALFVVDHPRSRGVYLHSGMELERRQGSSPLARGLLRRLRAGLRLQRIIPARAGFTCGRTGRGTSLRDHPRSRGVYAERVITSHFRFRIIPARAGFTPIFKDGIRSIGDHPRSRGVYAFTVGGLMAHPGSSPLARGLPSL